MLHENSANDRQPGLFDMAGKYDAAGAIRVETGLHYKSKIEIFSPHNHTITLNAEEQFFSRERINVFMSSKVKHNGHNSSGRKRNTDSEVIPVIEEQVKVGKRIVQSGRTVAAKKVHEIEEFVSVPLNHDELKVERLAIGKYIDTMPPPSRQEGDTLIIPVIKEEVVVEKRILLVEELRITKREVTTEFTRHMTVRKEEVKIKRKAAYNDKS